MNYIKLVLNFALQVGDVITIVCDANAGVNFTSTNSSAAGADSHSVYAMNGISYTVSEDDGIDGSYELYCWRRTSAGTNITSVTIMRPALVTVGAKGYATYVNSDNALDFTGKSIKAYTISSTDGQALTLTQKNKVAKNEPVLLYSSINSDSQSIPVILESEATATAGNRLVAGTGAAVTWTADDAYYILYTGGENSGFYKANNSTIAVGKAYLDLSGLPVTARSFNLNFDDESTGVSSVNGGEMLVNNGIYDLQGRRVDQPTNGMYVVNGKKVIIK